MSAPSVQPLFDGIDTSHWGGHVLSLFATVGAVVGILPAIAAFAGLVWYCIQIWESKSFQKLLIRRRARVAKRHLESMKEQKERLERDLRELQEEVQEAERENGKPSDVVGRIS
jgi:F0F1-type ATP synthase membrane subunit b/b'